MKSPPDWGTINNKYCIKYIALDQNWGLAKVLSPNYNQITTK